MAQLVSSCERQPTFGKDLFPAHSLLAPSSFVPNPFPLSSSAGQRSSSSHTSAGWEMPVTQQSVRQCSLLQHDPQSEMRHSLNISNVSTFSARSKVQVAIVPTSVTVTPRPGPALACCGVFCTVCGLAPCLCLSKCPEPCSHTRRRHHKSGFIHC